MDRKRKSPASGFKQLSPFNPISGQYAGMGGPSVASRISMAQVIEADTYDNVLVCRGWDLDKDPNCKYLINRMVVGKPYGVRGTFPYAVGNMLPVVKVRTHFGDTPGMAHTTVGQPADLNEAVDILVDDDGKPVAWLVLDGSGGSALIGKLDKTLSYDGSATVSVWTGDSGSESDSGENIEAEEWCIQAAGGSLPANTWVVCERINGHWYVTAPPNSIRFFSCTLASALASTDASKSSVTLTAIDGGPSPSGSQTVYNPRKCCGASSDAGLVCCNQATSQYEFVTPYNGSGIVRGVITGSALTSGGSATATLYINGSAVTGLTVYDDSTYPLIKSGNSVSGVPIRAYWDNDLSKWLIIAARCP